MEKWVLIGRDEEFYLACRSIYRFIQAGKFCMEDQSQDIFESDHAFIEVVSTVLLAIGIFSLSFVLLCKAFLWNICDLKWVPLFGGFELGRADLLAINLPLALLILGIGLRLYTGFGWVTCLTLMTILMGSFSAIAWKLIENWDEYARKVMEKEILPQDYPILESIVVNIAFAIVCFLGVSYLLMPSVRRIYWGKKPPTLPID
ncbi:MAG: hypothetical protein SF052_26725 [Bacteroidia bacterium]|nr:hypothetical protein [Bacteroidia bacterium]